MPGTTRSKGLKARWALRGKAPQTLTSALEVAEKDLSDVDDDVKEQMKRDLYDRVEDRINAAMVANLPADKVAGFNEVLDKGNEEAVQAYCASAIPNLAEVVAQELLSFQETYLHG